MCKEEHIIQFICKVGYTHINVLHALETGGVKAKQNC
jgi:hypothetical protein